MPARISFEHFRESLTDLRGTQVVGDEVRDLIEEAAGSLTNLPVVDRVSLAALIQQHPSWVPVLGSCVRLSHEALLNQLRARTGSAAWTKTAQTEPMRIITALDDGFNLVDEIRAQRNRTYSFADILLERYSSRTRAAGSISRGRSLEDEVEGVAAGIGLLHEMRTRFTGRGGRSAPCDIAIPSGADALIVGSAKGFNSTGSKLTDAVREVEEMASVRLPRQFVFAFVDGIGWLRRERDLRRLYDLWASDEINGLYSLASMRDFEEDLRGAARLLGLLGGGS